MKRRALNVVSPCSENIDNFESHAEGHFCRSCERVVIDMTRMTEKAAFKLVEDAHEQVCGLILRDQNGDAVFRQEPKRSPVVAAAIAVGSMLAAACGSNTDSHSRAVAAQVDRVRSPAAKPEDAEPLSPHALPRSDAGVPDAGPPDAGPPVAPRPEHMPVPGGLGFVTRSSGARRG